MYKEINYDIVFDVKFLMHIFKCMWYPNETIEFYKFVHQMLVYNPTMDTSVTETI